MKLKQKIKTQGQIADKVFFGLIVIVLVIFLSPVLFAIGSKPLANLPVYILNINKSQIEVEIVTGKDLKTGLMFRKELGENKGMLFVFDSPRRTSMWMKNTFIPLSVAFIDKNGKILNIEHMKPLTRNSHWSSGIAAYALEVNQGWFEKNNIEVGDNIKVVKTPDDFS
ncbi:MAG: DUF192 domain-containing protein [bacterium]